MISPTIIYTYYEIVTLLISRATCMGRQYCMPIIVPMVLTEVSFVNVQQHMK